MCPLCVLSITFSLQLLSKIVKERLSTLPPLIICLSYYMLKSKVIIIHIFSPLKRQVVRIKAAAGISSLSVCLQFLKPQ